MKVLLYSKEGKKKQEVVLNPEIYGVRINDRLLELVRNAYSGNLRKGTVDTKTRGEVRGGGKKPWKQKGTGRARHGSSRSPIWVGGGVTHGPLAEKNYKRKISKSMRAQALFSVLSKKQKDREILFVDSLEVSETKTKNAKEVMKNLAKASKWKIIENSKKPKILVALYGRNEKIEKSFRNLPQLEIVFLKNLNPLDVLNYRYLLIERPEESVKFLETRG